MNFGKLRHVVAVDRFGSISEAARQLNVTQSAVTKAVADIERELGHPLFDRHARGVVSTLAGRDFIERARRIVADMDQLEQDSRAQLQAREAMLRLVICPASLEDLLNRTMRNFIIANPSVRVHLHATAIENGLRLLRQGDVDLCIGARDRLEAVEGIECAALPDLHASLYARNGHPLEGKPDLQPVDLAAFPVIVPDLKGPYIDRLSEALPDWMAAPRRLHIIENYQMVGQIVRASDTIGIISTGYAVTHSFRNHFCTLDFNLGPTMPLGVAWRSNWPQTRQMALFRSTLNRYPLSGQIQPTEWRRQGVRTKRS